MAIWQAIVLGAVQGLAEFLPVSSSGHLLLLQRLLGISEGGLFFDVILHIATLVPICIVLKKQIAGLFKKPFNKLFCLIVATIPACITGVLLSDKIESAFYSKSLLSACLISAAFLCTAGELIIAERIAKKNKKQLTVKYSSALIMGVAQGIAVIPGLSRSGTVLSAGTFARLEKEENANFTFLMSIPIILGAGLVSGIKLFGNGEITIVFILPTLFGAITAMVTGYIAITFMLKIIGKANYKWFSLYLLCLSCVSVLTYVIWGI